MYFCFTGYSGYEEYNGYNEYAFGADQRFGRGTAVLNHTPTPFIIFNCLALTVFFFSPTKSFWPKIYRWI